MMPTRDKPQTENLEAALDYLRRGVSVVPLHDAPGGVCSCGKHVWPEDNSAGKHTHVKWEPFQGERPAEAQVRRWWRKWPTANIGGIMGKVSGLVCIESDSERKTAWVRETCGEPQTETHQAVRGPHYLFLYPQGGEIPSCKVGPGVEIKSEGTLIVLPPSVHPSGHIYTTNGLLPSSLPEGLLAAIRERRTASPQQRMSRAELHVSYSAVPKGEQHNALTRLIGHYIAKGYDRNDVEEMALMVGAQYDPPADPEHVLEIVESLYETHERNRAAGKDGPESATPVLLRLSEVEAQDPQWLWHPYLLRSQLNLLAGPTGGGKSYLALDCAARLTSGRNPFEMGPPGWDKNLPMSVLYMAREDDAPIIRRRFERLGGDPARLWLFSSKLHRGKESIVTLADDLPVIERALREWEPDLLVIDNLAAFLGARIDTRRMNQVRPILDELVDAAAEARTAVWMTAHLSKREGVHVLDRIAESVEFIYRPRSILFLAEDREDAARERRVLTHEKLSYGRPGESRAFRITDAGLFWEGVTETTSRELLMPEQEQSTPSKLEEAEEFLRSMLAEGPRPAEEVTLAAWKAHIKEITLERARKRLHVKSYCPKPGRGAKFYWGLPTGGGSAPSPEGEEPI